MTKVMVWLKGVKGACYPFYRECVFLLPFFLVVTISCGKKPEGQAKDHVLGQDSDAAVTPLKRNLADSEYAYGEGMRLAGTEMIKSGIFAGYEKRIYRSKNPGFDELIAKEGAVYRKTVTAPKTLVDKVGGDIVYYLFFLTLRDTAFALATDYSVPPPQNVVKTAQGFAMDCIRECTGIGMHYFVYNGYAFGCINDDNKTLKLDVVSEGIYKAEKLERIRGGKQ